MFRSKQNLRRGAALIAGALAIAAAAPAAADADSIAYVKDGNVYLSTPDGSRQYQVTTSGGYSSVTQDDFGDMIAVHGTRFHYLRNDGTLKADFYTPVSAGPGAQAEGADRQWWGPFDPRLSPSGYTVAYHYYYNSMTYNPTGCGGVGCVETYLRRGTGYSRPTEITALDHPQFKGTTGWIYPSWITDATGGEATVLSSPSSPGMVNLVTHTPYPLSGTGVWEWGTDGDALLQEGELTRDRTKMAFVAGDNHDTLRVYRLPYGITGDEARMPRGCYVLGDPVGGRFESPTWSPDGSKLAHVEGDGIYVSDVLPLTHDRCNEGASAGSLVIPGGRSADWGPADVPPARVVVDPPRPPIEQPQPRPQPRIPDTRTPDGRNGGNGGGGNGSGGNGGSGVGGVVTTPGGDRVALAAKAVTAKALAGAGVKLDVRCTKACRVTTTLRVSAATARKLRLGRQRTIGSASTRLKAKGAKALTVKVSPRLRARFAKVGGGSTVKLVVKVKPAKGKATTRTLSLKVT